MVDEVNISEVIRQYCEHYSSQRAGTMRLTLVITEVNQRFGFKGSASYLGEVKHGPYSIVKLPDLCQTEECLIALIEPAVTTLSNVSLRIDKQIHGYQPKVASSLLP